jgi:hypothetical protein
MATLGAHALLRNVPARCVVADKARDATALRQAIAAAGAKAVIPSRANQREKIRWSKAIYRHRDHPVAVAAENQLPVTTPSAALSAADALSHRHSVERLTPSFAAACSRLPPHCSMACRTRF